MNEFISNREGDARMRPHVLCLTGDQIYADDVSLALLLLVASLGKLLLGEAIKERFEGGINQEHSDVAPGPNRAAYIAGKTTLSSDYGRNHLLYFAEFVGMYALAWSDELWPRALLAGDVEGLPPLPSAEEIGDEWWLQERDAANAVASYARRVREVRRVLANVPTMMTFDDHEVTDDWNIDLDWSRSSRGVATTRRVVRNGLCAYALFQGWGNNPEAFTVGPGLQLLDELTVPPGELAAPIAGSEAKANALLDLRPDVRTKADERVAWDWSLDGEGYRIISLDTRTRRGYEANRPFGPPALLGAGEPKRQISDRLPDDGRLLIVIAPAPILGHPVLEEFLQPLMASRKPKRADALAGKRASRSADFEFWAARRDVFEDVLRRLAAAGSAVVLSGDVHYGFSCSCAYYGPGGMAPARIVQLCASSAKNSDVMTGLLGTVGFAGIQARGWFGFPDVLGDAILGELRNGLLAGAAAKSVDLFSRQLLFEFTVRDRLTAPTVLPSGPWFSDQALAVMKALVDPGHPGDWSYAVSYAKDARSTSSRLSDAGLGGKAEVLRRIAGAGSREVVGAANFGVVRFGHGVQGLEVAHDLHWRAEGAPGLGDAPTFTRHVLPLHPPADGERPKVSK